MNKTSIEWVQNPDGTQGYTWNPITGCLNHVNGMCKGGGFPCYAYRLANGRLKQRYLANLYCVLDGSGSPFNDPFYPRFWPKRLAELQRGIDSPDYQRYIRQPAKGIFVCDMGELFGDWLPERWTAEVLETIADDSNSPHRFYLLTKQPQNLAKWSPFPENCWVGVTVTADGDMTKAYYGLAQIEAKVKYVSCEPLLGAITMKSHRILKEVDWLIIGAQTKPTVMPRIEWLQEIVEAADRAGIPVFQKDNLKPLLGDNLRQELPE